MSNTLTIATRALSKHYGDIAAVSDVTLQVQKGTIFGFIGPSGSGKTTTIRLLTGAATPTSGKVQVLNESPADFSQATKAQIGYMPQHFALYPDLTVRENLNFAASIYGMGLGRRKRLQHMLNFVELEEAARRPTRDLSGGMQRRVSLAATLIHDPDVIFLDEPTTGIDPVLRRKFWDHFRELQDQGKTLFVTTQYVSDAAYCDQVAMIVNGSVLVVDSPEGLRHRAFHGDILEIVLSEWASGHWDDNKLAELEALPDVRQIAQIDRRRLRIIVEEAAVALPRLVSWFEQEDVEIASAEETIPSFDDVFVELVKGQPSDA